MGIELVEKTTQYYNTLINVNIQSESLPTVNV